MTKESVLNELHKLDLPKGSYMVMGSGIMDALGIRSAEDIDLVVTDDIYAKLRDAGWQDGITSQGKPRLEHEMFQVYPEWTDEDRVKKLDELIDDADWVDGVAFNSLSKLRFYKERRGREKDLVDLKLIEEYEAEVNPG